MLSSLPSGFVNTNHRPAGGLLYSEVSRSFNPHPHLKAIGGILRIFAEIGIKL